ncbi:MAG: serine/threonine protein kinase [Kofleriaceae bacterium]|nr:serine/threonine protein kinase [Myxococcales bacterium]MCB9564153.1 serine/threonine protein kinase [Kofleriaceae bacterium]MCB9572479.1 serine/threonine protein kinase [Kofleriaceae bacterium]
MTIAAGTVLDGRYRLRRPLGRGGLGEVHEAEDLRTGAAVAIKLLLPALRTLEGALRRFEREAAAGGFLQHPNLVDVTALGALPDGTLYLVMELVAGEDLGKLIARGPVPPRRALGLVRQVLGGLHHLHALGLVHRDLKPDNLMIATGAGGEVVKILDFGLVKLMGHAEALLGAEKLTATGVVFGTPLYMAPEQALGRPVDARADLYAIGVILYELLTGQPPFRAADAHAVMKMHVGTPAPALVEAGPGAWSTPALEALVAQALRKDRRQRHADAAAMIAAVDAAAATLGPG